MVRSCPTFIAFLALLCTCGAQAKAGKGGATPKDDATPKGEATPKDDAAPKKEAKPEIEYWLTAEKSVAEDDIACSQITGPDDASCKKSSTPVTLQPGQAYVIDDFLNASDMNWLRTAYNDMSHFSESETFNSKWMESRQLPPSLGLDDRLQALLHRITGHSNAKIRSQSALKDERWAYNGEYFLDHWQFRKYSGANGLQAHIDTGLLGRCLSATLHLGGSDTEVDGGDFKTFKCRNEKKGKCFGYGWQYDKKLPEANGIANDNLETLASVPYKPGRLIYFLAETVHGVEQVMRGDRNVLFMWQSCSPTLVNGATRNGHLSHVRHLVERGADFDDALPETGLSPTSVATDSGHRSILEYLLEKGADAEVPDNNKVLPIHRAARAGHLPVLEVLVKSGANVGAPDGEGKNALMHACEAGHAPVAEHLALHQNGFEAGQSFELAAQATLGGHCSVVEMLTKKGGVDVRTSAAGDTMPLMHRAAALGHVAMVECLAEMGAEVAAGDSNRGSPPLHPAAARGNPEIAKLLMSKGALAGAADQMGNTALHYAAEHGHLDMCELLLEESPNKKELCDAKDGDGQTPKQKADQAGHRAIVKFLKKARKSTGKERKRRKGKSEL